MAKYKGLLDDIKEKQAGKPAIAATATPSPALPPPAREVVETSADRRKPGRPKGGKSSNPEFVQTTAYVEEAVHIAVKKTLLDQKDLDYSSLVNDLLKRWVMARS